MRTGLAELARSHWVVDFTLIPRVLSETLPWLPGWPQTYCVAKKELALLMPCVYLLSAGVCTTMPDLVGLELGPPGFPNNAVLLYRLPFPVLPG